MPDSLETYLEAKPCDDCGSPPVQVLHFGELSNGEKAYLCKKCFNRRIIQALREGRGAEVGAAIRENA